MGYASMGIARLMSVWAWPDYYHWVMLVWAWSDYHGLCIQTIMDYASVGVVCHGLCGSVGMWTDNSIRAICSLHLGWSFKGHEL